MKITARVRFLNFFRNIFRIPMLEKLLAKTTRGKSPDHFYSKLVPNPYQYAVSSFRTVNLNGLSITVDISDYLGHGIYFGFEGEEQRSYNQLFGLVSKGDTVLDIGSNIGYTLLSMAKRSGNGKVIGFEPDRINYQRCLKNVNQNKFTNLQVYNVGLGDKDQALPMEVRASVNRGGNRVSIDGQGEVIEIKKLDSFISTLNLDKVNLIKIDVEGYELNVLKGSEQILERFHPVLFIEVNDDNIRDQGGSAKSLIELLIQKGYNNIVRADSKEKISANTNFIHCHFDIIAH